MTLEEEGLADEDFCHLHVEEEDGGFLLAIESSEYDVEFIVHLTHKQIFHSQYILLYNQSSNQELKVIHHLKHLSF